MLGVILCMLILGFQPYLNLINKEQFRVALSRFRVSAHRLEVETGRWHKPVAVPFYERKCRTCLNCLEGEFHFLLECPLYHELRKNIVSLFSRTQKVNDPCGNIFTYKSNVQHLTLTKINN